MDLYQPALRSPLPTPSHTNSNPFQSVYWRLFAFNAIQSPTTIIKKLLVIIFSYHLYQSDITARIAARRGPSDMLVTRMFKEADAY